MKRQIVRNVMTWHDDVQKVYPQIGGTLYWAANRGIGGRLKRFIKLGK